MTCRYLADPINRLSNAARKLEEISSHLDLLKDCEPIDYESIIGGLRYNIRQFKSYLREYMLLTIEQEKQLDNWFSYHPPKGDQAERYEIIREAGKRLAGSLLWKSTEEVSSLINYVEETISLLCPASGERAYALENLEKIYNLYMQGNNGFAIAVLRFSVIMPANAAIACNEEDV